jgi:hypothetical protein
MTSAVGVCSDFQNQFPLVLQVIVEVFVSVLGRFGVLDNQPSPTDLRKGAHLGHDCLDTIGSQWSTNGTPETPR